MGGVAARTRGTFTILRHLPGQRGALRRERRSLERNRDARARALVRYAAAQVPYYRDLPALREVRGADDLALLPLLDRETVQAEAQRLRAPRGVVEFRTTGSTAAPLTVWHDRASLLANIAYSERERSVEALLAGRSRRYSAFEIRAPGGTLPRVEAFYAEASFRPLRPGRALLSVDAPPEEVLAAIERHRPEVVRSYGGYLELLFRTAAAAGGLRHRPRVVVYSGDTMSSGGRQLIEREFGIPVLSRYTAVECFKIAFTCERRDGFHVHEDLCHVRLVDPAGRDVEPGEPGEIVISNLVNRGTVLLNYRIGDIARLAEEPCRCGRRSIRLVRLEGRVDELIQLRGGTYVYPTRVWHVFRGRPEILRYQVVQRAPTRFELRVVVAGDTGERAAAEAAGELAALLGGAAIDVTRHEALPASPGGRFRHVVPLAPTEEAAVAAG